MTPAPLYIIGLGLPGVFAPGAGHALANALCSASREAEAFSCAFAKPVLPEADVLVGGKEQLALYPEHSAERLVVGADIEGLVRRMAENRIQGKIQVALCSGEPLYFGLGGVLTRRFGPEGLRILPGISSLQGAAAVLGFPWEGARSVSLHGRSDWLPLAHALLEERPVALLADSRVHPAAVAAYLRERGREDYALHLLEGLYLRSDGVAAARHVRAFSVEEALEQMPGCARASNEGKTPDSGKIPVQGCRPPRILVLLPLPAPKTNTHQSIPEKTAAPAAWRGSFGLPDAAFAVERGILTKTPVRGAALAALGIAPTHTVWDLGAGSGAVGIEAARLAHKGLVLAVEKDPVRITLVRENRKRFGAANLEIVEARLPGCLPSEHSEDVPHGEAAALLRRHSPQRIFVGGGLGGDAEEACRLLRGAWQSLEEGGRLVCACVLLSSLERSRAVLAELGARVELISLQASQSKSLGGDVHFEGHNPVFLVIADKICSQV